jgi:rod shape-determining protein MreC
MESVLGRYRNLIILVGVLFLQVLGLAVQVKRGPNAGADTRLIRIWAVGAISPFERGIVWVQNSGSNLWHNYFYLRGVRAENRELKSQIEQMRLEEVRLSEDAAQAHRLQSLLAFKEQYIAKTEAAQVIGSSGSDFSRVVYIDKGENDGLKRDMAVMTAEGIVGKVLNAYPSVAQVLLISDQSSGVGVILEKSRLQGILRGTPNGEVVLERVMSDETVPVGETVLTSGGDQIFPKGLPVGTVTKVGSGKDLFLNIKVKPAADLSRLEEVLVLVEKQDRQAVADDSSQSRTADILAARLPSVPDKPPDATTTKANAEGANGAAAANAVKTTTGVKLAPAGKISAGTAEVRSNAGASETAKVVTPAAPKTNFPSTTRASAPTGAANGSPKPATSTSKPIGVKPSVIPASGAQTARAGPSAGSSAATQTAAPKVSSPQTSTRTLTPSTTPKAGTPQPASPQAPAPKSSADDASPN